MTKSISKTNPTTSQLLDILTVDDLQKIKGTFIARYGFFYTSGKDSQQFAMKVIDQLADAGFQPTIVDHGEVWKPFKGSAPTRQQSHWWVQFTLA